MASSPLNAGKSDDRVTVNCLYCDRPNELARRTMTFTCRHCNKALRLEDLPFSGYHATRAVETCGIITIEKKGNVVSKRVHCGGLVVRGRLHGNVISRGPVLVGPDAEIKGDVTAPSIAIGPGAILEGDFRIGDLAQESPAPQSA